MCYNSQWMNYRFWEFLVEQGSPDKISLTRLFLIWSIVLILIATVMKLFLHVFDLYLD
jgi:hypothetical protein